jgi:DNA-binding NtrC family response regulator
MEAHSVLVVDDERAMRDMLASALRDYGYRVEAEPCAKDALARLAQQDFDVVLSDVRMPGQSGLELVGELRRLRPRLPVILMTGGATAEAAGEALRAGAFDYVSKPFDIERVLLVVELAARRPRRG